MPLPETTILNFFNKVLISLSELVPAGDSCSIDSLISQCKSIVFGGERGDYELILDYCKNSGLVQIRMKSITISTLGQKFLDANRERYFEINEAQKQLIAERIIFKGAWSHYARELFELFSLNQGASTYELSIIDNSLSDDKNKTIHFFKYLGILQDHEFVIRVDKKYSELVYQLTADGKGITELQLEKSLMENRRLGAQAENVVVEFEKQRLKELGKMAQAELVKRISTVDVSAGYDVESFDGITDEIFPNRFIEVKATQGNEIRFYWSNNEMRVAKKKKDTYWIYMLVNFKEDKPQESIPIIIQNPEHCIKKNNCLIMKAHTFLISEIDEVKLSEHNINEVMWRQLV